MELFVPRRPLKPTRRERKKLKSQNLSGANILIRVIRAFNVPVRENMLANANDSQYLTPNDDYSDPVVQSDERVADFAGAPTPFDKVLCKLFFICSNELLMHLGSGYCITIY